MNVRSATDWHIWRLAYSRGYVLAAACFLLLAGPIAAAEKGDVYSAEERAHWSLQPRSRPAVPAVDDAQDRAWPSNPIDAYLLSRLKQADLQPSPQADRRTLVRRLHFNLVGLPPTPEAMKEFLSDAAPDAYERLVDRLLADPRYGEAWGQHWLDVVRYAESEGFEYDRHRAGAWRFRDYVVQSFNADKPYDQFVLEQVAGDERPLGQMALSANDPSAYEAKIAAGFHRLGPVRRNAGNTDVAFSRNEVLTEMTDAIGATFLGMTVGCARCHDHMFDAIRQRDYYRLQAFLAATHERDIQLGDPDAVKRWNSENDEIQAEIKRLRDALDDASGEEREKLAYQLKAAQKRQPTPLPTISSVANDAAKRTEIHVLERGQTDNPKEIVGPRVLGVLLTSSVPEYPADCGSPKTVLGHWLVNPTHPLTARVFVNRLWHYQFGQGIVATPNDFGVNGAPPSHPQLLDYLANELVAGQWSTKRLQRLIVTSSTYRQSSQILDFGFSILDSGGAQTDSNPKSKIQNPKLIDPDNRLLWHFPRRRLTAEELRDSLLAISGRLNASFGGPSVMPPVKKELVDLLYDPAQWQVTPETREHDRRSIYLVAKRNLRLPFLEVFDQPDLQTSCSRRQSSTHAPQALEMLNGELASSLAPALAQRLKADAGDSHPQQIDRAFSLVAGREPTAKEREVATEFLRDQSLEEFALAMLNLNAFLYVD
jgi:uncharacterized protein DUF1553/uncharacterized protein DUF1549